MAFEDTTPARSRYSGEGFRHEADFREGTTTFQVGTPPVAAAVDGEPTVTIVKRPPNLTYVFDDPAEGEPGRDRMLVHGVWELVLALALGAMAYLLYREQINAFSGPALRGLLLGATTLGFAAAAAAVALRAGVVNLAVGPVAVAAAIFFVDNSNGGVIQPLLMTVGLCAAVGAMQGLAMVGLHVPAWAASLAASLGVFAWASSRGLVHAGDTYDARPHAYWWLAALCVVSIGFGLAGLSPTVRRTFGRFRAVSDPADRRGWPGAIVALSATVASSVLAGLAGVLSAAAGQTAASSDGFMQSALAIGIALVGGTSAFGRRGGIFGTVLAAGLVAVVIDYVTVTGMRWSGPAIVAAVVLIGLGVTRLIERFGRPVAPAADEDDEANNDWLLRTHAMSSGGTPAAAAWPPPKPATATATGGLWASDDAWGTTAR